MIKKLSYWLNSFMYVATLTQAREIFQIVQLVLSIMITLFLFIINFVDWYKKSKADGVITEEELEEGKKIAEDTKDKIKEIIK